MLHLLAPVPAVHLVAAQDTFRRMGRVAFGSNAFDVLNKVNGKDVTVWIAASSTSAPPGGVPGIEIGKIVLCGQLAGIVNADRRGNHPDPSFRPATTLADKEEHWAQFWEVVALEALRPTLSPIGLRAKGPGRLIGIPLGPVLIDPPDRHTP
jgi:hypothetical protein